MAPELKQFIMTKRRSKPSLYYLTLVVTLALVLLGIIMISSASSILAYTQQDDSFYYLKKQLVSVLVGLIAMFVLSVIDYRRLKSLAPVVMLGSLGLLGLVIFIGKVAYGSSRWFTIFGFTFQPSELAKLSIAVYIAYVLSLNKKIIRDLKSLFKPVGLPVLLTVFLVLLQPDLGTAFTIALTVYLLLFLAEAKGKYLALLGLSGLTMTAFFIASADYRLKRFIAFIDPWKYEKTGGFHIIQSLLALGSGGVRGIGLGLSRQKFGFLPTPFTDFIFAVIGEEMGLVGALLVICLYLSFGFLGIKIANRAKDRFGRFLAGGITAMIVSQAIINLGAVTGLLPITGIPLPLISFGGSSLIFTLTGVGILLNVAANGRRRITIGAPSEDSDMWRGNRRPRLSRSGLSRSA